MYLKELDEWQTLDKEYQAEVTAKLERSGKKSQIWSLCEYLKSTHNGVQVSADSWFWTTPGKSSCPL